MSNSQSAVRVDPQSDYPLANTEARRMLAAGLEKANDEKGLSQRTLAKQLGYRTSVVLSHMASGRAPIPIDRAPDFARMLGLDLQKFLLAVMEQRHPDINFGKILGVSLKTKPVGKTGRTSYVMEELEDLAGRPLDEMTPDRINILREVVSDKSPARRWASLSEVPILDAIREKHPGGVSLADRKKIEQAIDKA